MESLDLVTSNAEEARTWITGLRYLMAGISDEDSLAKRQRTHDQYPLNKENQLLLYFVFIHLPPLPSVLGQRVWGVCAHLVAQRRAPVPRKNLYQVEILDILQTDFMYTYTHLIFLNVCVCVTWLKQTFEEADKNGDGLLNIEEIYQLLHKLNVNLPRRKVKQMFQVRI